MKYRPINPREECKGCEHYVYEQFWNYKFELENTVCGCMIPKCKWVEEQTGENTDGSM